MNHVSVVGTVVAKRDERGGSVMVVRVGRPFVSDAEFDDILFHVDPVLFKAELGTIEKDELVAVKGRCETNEGTLRLVAERVQVY